MMVNEDNYAI